MGYPVGRPSVHNVREVILPRTGYPYYVAIGDSVAKGRACLIVIKGCINSRDVALTRSVAEDPSTRGGSFVSIERCE